MVCGQGGTSTAGSPDTAEQGIRRKLEGGRGGHGRAVPRRELAPENPAPLGRKEGKHPTPLAAAAEEEVGGGGGEEVLQL